MLGWRAAANLGLHVGDRFNANGTANTVVGIYSTGIPSVMPGPCSASGHTGLQQSCGHRHAGLRQGDARGIRHQGGRTYRLRPARAHHHPHGSQFGRADRNLIYLQAAVNGSTVLAILIGAVIIGNTMLLSLFERTREFGLLRAVGWTRRRTVGLLLGESLLLAFLGAGLGVALSFVIGSRAGNLPALKGVLHPNFTEGAFWRALFSPALVMTLIGALYPTTRAALLSPLEGAEL